MSGSTPRYNNQTAIKKAAPKGISMCMHLLDQGSPNVGPATHFVSWALLQKVPDLTAALEQYVEEQELDPASTFFWICDFSIRQVCT